MYSFTDRYLASLLAELAATKHVQIRIYRDGEQFLEEFHRGNPITNLFNGIPTIHVRIKPTSRKLLMHLNFVFSPIMWRPSPIDPSFVLFAGCERHIISLKVS
jgi:hypothetical protein